MPGIVLYGHQWRWASDDITLFSLISSLLHLVWVVVLMVYVPDIAESNTTSCQSHKYVVMLSILGVLMFLQFILSTVAFFISLRGSIWESKKRSAVAYLVPCSWILELGVLAITIYGTVLVNVFDPDCLTGIRGRDLTPVVDIILIYCWVLQGIQLVTWFLAYRAFPKLDSTSDLDSRRKYLDTLCCMGGLLGEFEDGEETSNTLADVVLHFFEELNMTLSDLVASFQIVAYLQSKRRSTRLQKLGSSSSVGSALGLRRPSDEFVTPPGAAFPPEPHSGPDSTKRSSKAAALEDLVEAQHFLRFAVAAYGAKLYVYASKAPCCGGFLYLGGRAAMRQLKKQSYMRSRIVKEKGSGSVEANALEKEAILQYAGIREKDLVYISQDDQKKGLLPYYIALDHTTKSVVLAIRGTLSLADCLTDLRFDPAPIDEWLESDDPDLPPPSPSRTPEDGATAAAAAESASYAHRGILNATSAVLSDLKCHQLLENLLESGRYDKPAARGEDGTTTLLKRAFMEASDGLRRLRSAGNLREDGSGASSFKGSPKGSSGGRSPLHPGQQKQDAFDSMSPFSALADEAGPSSLLEPGTGASEIAPDSTKAEEAGGAEAEAARGGGAAEEAAARGGGGGGGVAGLAPVATSQSVQLSKKNKPDLPASPSYKGVIYMPKGGIQLPSTVQRPTSSVLAPSAQLTNPPDDDGMDRSLSAPDAPVAPLIPQKMDRGSFSTSQRLRPTLQMSKSGKKAKEMMAQVSEERLEGQQGQPWRLVVTGHSLGAGVAALVALKLKRRYPSLYCWSYAAPGALLSRDLAVSMMDYCTSVVVGKDWVSRLNYANAHALWDSLMMASTHCRMPKFLITWGGLFGCITATCRDGWMFSETEDLPEEPAKVWRTYCDAKRGKFVSSMLPGLSFITPGRTLFFRPEKRHSRKTRTGYYPVWLQPGKLQEEGLLISKRCFVDHFPDFQLDTLTNVVKRMLQEEEERMSASQPQEPSVASPLREPMTSKEETPHSGRTLFPSLPSSLLPAFNSMKQYVLKSNQQSPQVSEISTPAIPLFGDGSTAPDEHQGGSPVSNNIKKQAPIASEDVKLSIPDTEMEPQLSSAADDDSDEDGNEAHEGQRDDDDVDNNAASGTTGDATSFAV